MDHHVYMPHCGQPFPDFASVLARVYEVTETRTQVQLADFLGIKQSSISDAKRRETIPAAWLLALVCVKNISPTWIMTGRGSKYFVNSDSTNRCPSCGAACTFERNGSDAKPRRIGKPRMRVRPHPLRKSKAAASAPLPKSHN